MDWRDALPAIAYMAAGGTIFTVAFAVLVVFERRSTRGALIFSAIVLAGFFTSLGLFFTFDRPAICMLPMMAGVYVAMWYGRRFWARGSAR